MSRPNATFSQSLMSFSDSLLATPTKQHSISQKQIAMFSSLRLKRRAKRPSLGEMCGSQWSSNGSQWSLYSANSLSNDEYNWSIQPNYLKMMNDTNLMDNCAAATEEIEAIRERVPNGQELLSAPNKTRTQRTVDPEQLLQWIVYMEKYLKAFSPNWRQVNEMDEQQRDASFNEQCDLRQYIASHNRIFNQMIEEEDSHRTRDVQAKYHVLLLSAIEKQCLLEGYPTVEDDPKDATYNGCTDINLDVYKLCSIDIEPLSMPPGDNSLLDHTLVWSRSTESLASNSDVETIITSDDGINFPTHPTTSKSSLFSDDQFSPFSSRSDFQREDDDNLESILRELDSAVDDPQETPATSSSSISACTLDLIKNVDECLHTTSNKVDNWLFHHPTKAEKAVDTERKVVPTICSSSSSGSELGSTVSIQWDNFQDIYTLTAPIQETTSNNDFLYFGDDYDDVLKSKRYGSSLSSISDMIKSSTSAPTTPSKSEKSLQISKNDTMETKIVNRKRKRVLRKSTKDNDSLQDSATQTSIPDDSSKMARDILLIAEDLRNNYMNLKPKDFDGILKICRENLGCLIVVLDKEQRHHHQSNESVKSDGDDRIYIKENCQCGPIGQFVARIVRFLYDCSRKVRRSAIYRFLLKILKHFYTMVKFLSQKVRVYRSLYGTY